MPVPEYTTPADVFARLRISDPAAHADHDYIVQCTTAANELVDNYLELSDEPVPLWNEKRHRVADGPPTHPRLEPPYPSAVARAATGTAVRIYRFKDAEADIADTWGDQGALRIPRDPLAGYRDLLNPWRPGAAWAPV